MKSISVPCLIEIATVVSEIESIATAQKMCMGGGAPPLTIGKPESRVPTESRDNSESLQSLWCAFKTRENREPKNTPGILRNIN